MTTWISVFVCRHGRFPGIPVLQIQVWASSWEQSINIVIVVLGPSVWFMSLIQIILISWKLCNHFLEVAVIIFAYLSFGNKDNQTRILPWQTPVAMWFKASLSHATGTFAAAACSLSLLPLIGQIWATNLQVVLDICLVETKSISLI